MLFRRLLSAAFVGTVAADFVIVTTTSVFSTSFKDTAAASKWSSKKESQLESAYSTYVTHLTADPKYASVTSAIGEFVATRTDVDASVITATDETTTYTRVPAWYTAMPKDVKDYLQSMADEREKIFSSVVSHDAAPAARPTGAVKYVGAGMAAAAAGAVILLKILSLYLMMISSILITETFGRLK
ncbi:uncharacterized protein BDR25DRAFT_78269 [Lindgomyces ingoldianus]|uniref:Uncharacterized protein n=1 Tax=Lindgomyces ingoldianus TaxID=673940 RepID=A0ACB6QJD9_9PLEO|nr:uncharacterized protein BDR25DRAFT_78269 [Lindgomyces ingoldianus]KAF2466437.1 hypothetical protein BDR25DRAFT_78269 [Lindgomyces ingoldianus]